MTKRACKLNLLVILTLLTLATSYSTICAVKASAGGDVVWAQTGNPPGGDAALGVAADSSGLYIVGYDSSPTGWQWRVEKRSLDTGEIVWTQINNPSVSNDAAYGVAVDGSGLYIAGFDNSPVGGDHGSRNREWRVEKRSLDDGEIIWTQTNNPSAGADVAWGIAVNDLGAYVVGYDDSPGSWQWRVEKRSLDTGEIVWTQTNNPSVSRDAAYGVAVDGSGIYVVGYDESPGVGKGEWRVEKRSLDTGEIVWTQTNDPSAGDDAPFGVAVDGSGLYIVGFDSSPGDWQWRVEKRSLDTGEIVWTQINNPSVSNDAAYGVAVDNSGLYVVGFDNPSDAEDWRWRVEKRSLDDGEIIWTQTNNPSAGADVAVSVAADSSGLYIVGLDNSPGSWQWRIEKRNSGLRLGHMVSVENLELLAPWIGLFGFLGAVALIAAKKKLKH